MHFATRHNTIVLAVLMALVVQSVVAVHCPFCDCGQDVAVEAVQSKTSCSCACCGVSTAPVTPSREESGDGREELPVSPPSDDSCPLGCETLGDFVTTPEVPNVATKQTEVVNRLATLGNVRSLVNREISRDLSAPPDILEACALFCRFTL